MSLNLVWN